MVPEKKRKIAKLLSLTVIIGGLLIIAGWMFDIGILTSISSHWRSTRLITAVGFALSGITVYFIVCAIEGEFDKAQVILSITSFTLVLIMGLSFFATVLGLSGVEELLVKRTPEEGRAIILGRPAMLAILNFILIAGAAVMVMWKLRKLQPKLKIIGLIVTVISAMSLLGYIFDTPALYHFMQGQGSAMAFPTAILFVLLGIALLCL